MVVEDTVAHGVKSVGGFWLSMRSSSKRVLVSGIISAVLFGLVVSTASANELIWQDNSNNEGGFAVEMLQGGVWTEVSRVGVNVASYTDTNTEGVYRVRAFLSLPDGTTVYSSYSNTAAKLNAPVTATVK